MEEPPTSKKKSFYKYLTNKHKILILLIIIYFIVLGYTTRKIDNSYKLCKIHNETETCQGELLNYSGMFQCCSPELRYSTSSRVPASNVTLTHIIIGLAIILITLYSFITDFMGPVDLNWRSAFNISKTELEFLMLNKGIKHGPIKIGPAIKMRFYMNEHKPWKWVVGAAIFIETGYQYYQVEVKPVWSSNRNEDHLIAIRKRKTEFTADELDKNEMADIVFIEAWDLKMGRKAKTLMKGTGGTGPTLFGGEREGEG